MRRLIPRFTIRTLLVATALVATSLFAFTTPFTIAHLQRVWNVGGADVIVLGNTSPPDDDDIRAELQRNGAALASSSLPVYSAPCTDYVDKPFRVPLFGLFQRHHRHYECGLQQGANPGGVKPVKIETSELVWKRGN